MKNNFKFGIILLLIISINISCDQKNEDFKFYLCDFERSQYNDPIYYSKWIENKEDALKVKLTFYNSDLNKRNLDSLNKRNLVHLYKRTAQYLFIIGGGGIWVNAEDCTAEIKNDTILIKYKIKGNSGLVGEAASSLICMEVDKRKYPNYKKMKLIYSRE